MKLNRTHLFITLSSLSLVVVLLIQVTWILKTAKVKEELFNEKANMVLSRTVEVLGADRVMCNNIASCVRNDSTSNAMATIGPVEVRKIDSLFSHYMKVYNVRVDYTFMIIKPRMFTASADNGFTNYIYDKELEQQVNANRLELQLVFPEKKQYILAEMGPTFITSVVLILVVLFMFWRTVLSLVREKQLSERTTDFLNNMTHEFKTPLTNIALAGRMVSREAIIHQPEKVKHYSDIIIEENEKLRQQVEHVLSLTALERGEIPIQKTSLDIHTLIIEAVKGLTIQVDNKGGELELQLRADNPVIHGDRTHLIHALNNLIDNSIKYSVDKPTIIIQTFNDSNQLVISVRDNGIGIAKEHQPHIFNKYYRVPTGDVHNVRGFGLGLAYTRKIIELHNGTITFKSEPAKGTTFTITILHG